MANSFKEDWLARDTNNNKQSFSHIIDGDYDSSRVKYHSRAEAGPRAQRLVAGPGPVPGRVPAPPPRLVGRPKTQLVAIYCHVGPDGSQNPYSAADCRLIHQVSTQ